MTKLLRDLNHFNLYQKGQDKELKIKNQKFEPVRVIKDNYVWIAISKISPCCFIMNKLKKVIDKKFIEFDKKKTGIWKMDRKGSAILRKKKNEENKVYNLIILWIYEL